MTANIQQFINMANFYNQMTMIMSAICVQKGSIAMENYVGRFFAADVLEFIVEYGKRIEGVASPEVIAIIARFAEEFEKAQDMVTPTQKPIHEMTLEEFEKVMNI